MAKIVIDGRELQGGMTGIGRFLHNFLKSLNKLDRETEYILLLNRAANLEFAGGSIRYHVIPESSVTVWDQVSLPGYLNTIGADLFFSPYYKLPVLAPCPAINTIHDVHFFTLPVYRRRNGFVLNAYYRLAGRLFCKKAKTVLTVSENTKKDILRVFHTPPEKIRVVYNGVDLNRFRTLPPLDVAARRKILFPKIKGRFILYVGNSKPHKNIPFLLNGYLSLPEEAKKNIQLVLAGADEEQLRCNGIVHNDRIITLPNVPDEELPVLYNAADVFVTPSLYEGFCLPVAEAMACGTPVFASNGGAIPEVLGEAGCLFDPSRLNDFIDKIILIIADDELRQSMSMKGLSRVRQFSIELFAKRIASVIDQSIPKP
ncbi:MAG TPA: glycosyltransferase family 1 protein [Syntrophales bacterium]|nr:glycosyltransferase family 1 protein [Syntrophales bacterium]